MADNYLQFTQSPLGSKLISTLGLPVPTPPRLKRASGAWTAAPLEGQDVLVAGSDGSGLGEATVTAIAGSGAAIYLPTDCAGIKEIKDAAAKTGTKVIGAVSGEASGDRKVHAIVFDASGMSRVSQLRDLYDTFHERARKVSPNGRVIVLGRPPEAQKGVEARTAQRALEGFTRSIGKEFGKKGITSHLIYVEKGAEDRLAGPLRFALAPNSAFVTGQVLTVSKQVSGSAQDAWTQPLAGKTALVTGAARGIGASIARILAREGARVVCLDRPGDDELEKVANEIGGVALAVDVTNEQAPQLIEKALKEPFGGVDIVVHNAGVTRDKTIARMRSEWWDMVMGINLESIIRINDRLLKGTIREGGRIVGVSSISGIAGNVGQTNYATSKAGVIGYTHALSQETAKKGISVNAVAPGFIETQMTNAMPAGIREAGRRLNALSQGGLPDDVAEAILFMSSPAAVGVNGQVLRVCGQNLVGA